MKSCTVLPCLGITPSGNLPTCPKKSTGSSFAWPTCTRIHCYVFVWSLKFQFLANQVRFYTVHWILQVLEHQGQIIKDSTSLESGRFCHPLFPEMSLSATTPLTVHPRLMLLCGGDLLESFSVPNLWSGMRLIHQYFD